jgi:transcription elongation factor GreB
MIVNYMSPESFERLRQELNTLLKEERPKIVASVSAAAAMGDRSENAEYIYGKRRLREIDKRVRFLQNRLSSCEVIDASKLSLEKVAFGLSVEVEDNEGELHTYKIIGPDELNEREGLVTYNSPLGRALLGKKVGDEIIYVRPKGNQELIITKIFYAEKK